MIVRLMAVLLIFATACGAQPAVSTTRSAKPGEITILAGSPLGEAGQIGDFLGAGGTLEKSDYQPNDFLAKAWRDVGFRHITFEALSTEGDERWFDITRDRRGKIRVGFENYDRHMDRYLNTLKARPFIYLGDFPRALSSQPTAESQPTADLDDPMAWINYSYYMPRDLKEWEDLSATIVRHNIERFGLRGVTYGTPCEPDYPGRFLYAPDDDTATQLQNSIAVYAATWRGVKSADPTARVGGPGTMNWQVTPKTTNAVSTIADWIRALAEYNAAASEKVSLDYVAWQDYAWSSDRISDGADAVSRMLSENGFDPNTPKMLVNSGWGSWSSDYLNAEVPPHRRASYIAHNIIREFKDPRNRQFALALYYFFHADDNWWPGDFENRDIFRRSGLVAFDTEGRVELTPMYAAFQMANAMATSGEIVESFAPVPLEAMAVRDVAHRRIIVTINNHSPQSVSVPVKVWDPPFDGSTVTRVVQFIDEAGSGDGGGLQAGARDELRYANPISFPLTLGPYASAQVTLSAQ